MGMTRFRCSRRKVLDLTLRSADKKNRRHVAASAETELKARKKAINKKRGRELKDSRKERREAAAVSEDDLENEVGGRGGVVARKK
jgi:hypothetical protein